MPDRPELRLKNIESILASLKDRFAVTETAGDIDLVSQKVQDLSIIVYAASQVGLAAAVLDKDTYCHLLDTKGYTALTGYSSDELEGLSFLKILCVSDDSHKIDRDGKFSFSEMSIRKKSGEVVPVELGIGEGMYNGRLAQVVYVLDISERKRLESEAERLRRKLEEAKKQEEVAKAVKDATISTSAFISHDMANPLQGLQALRVIPLDEVTPELYAGFGCAVDLLSQLNKKLMGLASGRPTDEIIVVDAKELVLDALLLVKTRYESASVLLNYNLDFDCKISVQKTDFKTALQNLLDNALEAIVDAEAQKIACWNGKKNVDVYLKKELDYVVLSVSDSGIGMNEDQLSKLFRSSFSTKVKDRGSGYGMLIVYNFACANKALIGASSDGVGKGSVFYLKFPCVG